MSILKPTPVSTERFTYSRSEQLLVAEASDLGLGHGRDFERVYDDACDVGLTLVSHVTGREVVYAIEREERDREGDVQFWELRPTPEQHRQHGSPPIGRVELLPRVVIFND